MAIVERLVKHVADFGVLYTKIHNYHWHVGGLNFLVVHQMTDGYYEDVADNYDSLAERILQLGGAAPASVKEYLALTGIKEETKKSFTATEVITGLKIDFEYLVAELHETRKAAADSNDAATDSLLTDIIAGLEKKIWMLNAALK